MGLVEIPCIFMSIYGLKYFGRRNYSVMVLTTAGTACLAIIPFSFGEYTIMRIILAMIGKFAITSAFDSVYVHSSEIFPTIVRHIGVGSCSIVGRIGSSLAPFIKEVVSGIYFVIKPAFIFTL